MNKANIPTISAIVAMAENRIIGKNNELPWRLPADLRHFKVITTGHTILMGRKTYESIGKPLPNRMNIILSRDPNFTATHCIIAHSFDEALQAAKSIDTKELFIIGGAEIYKQLLPVTQIIYLTLIHHIFEGDTYFPDLTPDLWQEISRETHQADNENPYPYDFLKLKRIDTR